jgi:hypothetical protein
MKVGNKVWIIEDKNPVEVTVEFVGDNQIAFHLNDKLTSRHNSEVYKTEQEALKKINNFDLVVFCRETCRQTGQIAVYKIDTTIDDYVIGFLGFRTRYNPELQYAVTSAEIFEKNRDKMEDFNYFEKLSEENKIVRL